MQKNTNTITRLLLISVLVLGVVASGLVFNTSLYAQARNYCQDGTEVPRGLPPGGPSTFCASEGRGGLAGVNAPGGVPGSELCNTLDSNEETECRNAIRECNNTTPNATEREACMTRVFNEAGIVSNANRTTIQEDCTQGSDSEHCGITRYLVLFINVLSVLAGIVIAGSIAYGGIQYSMSGSDPQKVSEAKNRIRNAIIALVFFIFGYSFLNFLVPGGLL